MSRSTLYLWRVVHRWTSLASMLVLLILCLTGLPLIFHDEITGTLAKGQVPADSHLTDLDVLVAKAAGHGGLFPGEAVRWISLEDDRPEIWIALAPDPGPERSLVHVVKFDARTGAVLAAAPPSGPSFNGVILKLHSELLAGAVGGWALAAIALLVLAATISGVLLYAPYMHGRAFGTVRRQGGARRRWLDLHNLFGIATAMWVGIVSFTGLLNAIADPVYDNWRVQALEQALRPYASQASPGPMRPVSEAVRTAAAALPGLRIRSIRYPDAEEGSPYHYLIWAIGRTPLTAQLFLPVLVDARTGALAPITPPPWYIQAIQLSRPLHFGDYGGLALKTLWALFDLVTIVILGSGLYLWIARRGAKGESIPHEAK